jgi:hypothetical protein
MFRETKKLTKMEALRRALPVYANQLVPFYIVSPLLKNRSSATGDFKNLTNVGIS